MLTGNATIRSISIVVLMSCLVTGCGGGASVVRHYVIDPVTALGYLETTSDDPPAIAIIDLSVPQYLERTPIATRTGGNRMRFSETHRWGENLRKNLLRALARNLSNALGSDDIGTPLNRSLSTPDVRLQLHIERFEQDEGGVVRLRARWQLSDNAVNQPYGSHSATLASDFSRDAGDYDGIVADMQSLFADLSVRIAETIMSVENES